MIKIKRVYEKPEKKDGFRVLVDRLWPRGMKKSEAGIDLWLKDIAPDSDLRKWFSHDPDKWDEFKKRYFKELGKKEEALFPILEKGKKETVTLLYGSREERFNNAVALKEHLDKKMGKD
jgi:uncharacterized protein YeaO (DUF488 family)